MRTSALDWFAATEDGGVDTEETKHGWFRIDQNLVVSWLSRLSGVGLGF